MSTPLALSVQGLTIQFPGSQPGSSSNVVDDISLSVEKQQIVGLVGESGAGKSMVALAAMGLVPAPGTITNGRVEVGNKDITALNDLQLETVRGRDVGIVFQDPLASFNPVRPIGAPLIESAMRHQGLAHEAAHQLAIEALDAVGIPQPARRLQAYPHEFSGGQRQRIMIALALINQPGLVIADEPTTALDTTIQAEILQLLKLRANAGGLLIITHDLAIAAEFCDRLCVMRHGKIVESGTTQAVLNDPRHQYTRVLVESIPKLRHTKQAPSTLGEPAPLLEVENLSVTYGDGTRAVDGVSFNIERGETVCLVGESGSGKSTIARALVGIVKPSAGSIRIAGQDRNAYGDPKAMARRIQMVFQDPYASLDPRWSVSRILSEPLRGHGLADKASLPLKVTELAEQVGIPVDALQRRPKGFSGGERQRICLARALALDPEILVADEPLSSLDMSIQGQMIALLKAIQAERSLTLLVITHDLAVVSEIAQRIIVMHAGQIVEQGPTATVLTRPQHPYTARLLAAMPSLIRQPERRR